jgi:hypothetical protein
MAYRKLCAILPWKAQVRLCSRYRRLMAKGKRQTVDPHA